MLTTLKVLTGGVITMYNFDRELETLTLNIEIKIKMFSFIRSLVYAEMEYFTLRDVSWMNKLLKQLGI